MALTRLDSICKPSETQKLEHTRLSQACALRMNAHFPNERNKECSFLYNDRIHNIVCKGDRVEIWFNRSLKLGIPEGNPVLKWLLEEL